MIITLGALLEQMATNCSVRLKMTYEGVVFVSCYEFTRDLLEKNSALLDWYISDVCAMKDDVLGKEDVLEIVIYCPKEVE